MGKLKVYPVQTKRTKQGQLTIEATVSNAIEDRLQKQADEAGVTLEEYIQAALAMVAKCETNDKGELESRKRKHLKSRGTAEDKKTRFYDCPHCNNPVFRFPKDYGTVDETMVTMREFCEGEWLTPDIKEYLSAVSKNPNALLSLLGTSDGHIKAAAKVSGTNYYKCDELQTFVLPKLAEVRRSINRIKGKGA